MLAYLGRLRLPSLGGSAVCPPCRSRPSFRDDAAHRFRDDLAHRSEMKDIPLQPELAVLTPELVEFLAFCRRQPAAATADVALGLADPVPDRLRGRFELLRQFLRRAAGADQLYHLATEFRCVGW